MHGLIILDNENIVLVWRNSDNQIIFRIFTKDLIADTLEIKANTSPSTEYIRINKLANNNFYINWKSNVNPIRGKIFDSKGNQVDPANEIQLTHLGGWLTGSDTSSDGNKAVFVTHNFNS